MTTAEEEKNPISQCVNEVFRLDQFINIASVGFDSAAHASENLQMHFKVRKLKNPSFQDDSPTARAALASAQQTEIAARQELNNGLSYLYELAVVKLWSLLEASVDDLVFGLLQYKEEWQRSEKLKKLEGGLVEFMMASEPEQAAYLMGLLKDSTKAELKVGVGRFETLLEVVGLAGPVDAAPRRVILELSNTRHLLVHRLGIVDTRFVTACPWLNANLGAQLFVGTAHYHLYSNALFWYLTELSRRMRAKNNLAPRQEELELLASLLDKINELESSRKESIKGGAGSA